MVYNGFGTTTYSPAFAFFSALNAQNQIQIFQLPLTKSPGAVSPAPVPQPIGTPLGTAQAAGAPIITAENTTAICDNDFWYTQANSASSIVLLLQVDTTSSYCQSSDTYSYMTLAAGASSFTTLTQAITQDAWDNSESLFLASGAIGGYVIQIGSQLEFYPQSNFAATPVPVGPSGITSAQFIGWSVGFTEGFWAITPTSGSPAVWRVDSAGNSASVYTYAGGDTIQTADAGVGDANYFYLQDTPQGSAGGNTAALLVQVPLTGTAAAKTFAPGDSSNFGLEQSNGTYVDYFDNPTSTTPLTLYALPVAGFANPIQLYQTDVGAGLFNSFSDAANYFFIDQEDQSSGGALTYTSIYLPFSSLTGVTSLVNSVFPVVASPINYLTYLAPAGAMLQIRGINDSTNGWGGGSLVALDCITGAVTPFTNASNAPYVYQAGYVSYYFNGFTALASDGTTAGIGIVALVPESNSSSPTAVSFYDATKHLMVDVPRGSNTYTIWY